MEPNELKEHKELKELANRINSMLKDLGNDDDRIRIIDELVLDGICSLCGALHMPCYCAPQYDI